MYHLKQIEKPTFLSDAKLKEQYRGKRVLVLGGDGFMGVHAATALQLLGAEVSVVSRRGVSLLEDTGIAIYRGHLLQKDVVQAALAGKDVIFDFAGSSGAVTSNRDAHRNFLSECEPHLNVLQCAADQPLPPLLVFCSSRTVYGKPEKLPVSESHRVAPISVYAIHKLALEHYLENFHKTHGLSYLIFRLSNSYGPYLWQEKKDYGVMNQFILKAFAKQPIRLFGDGSQLRDYIHIDDVVETFVRAAVTSACHNQIFNLGGPAPLSIKCAVETLLQHRPGSEVRFEKWPDDYQNAETGDYVSAMRKLRKSLPGLRQTSFERGVQRTLEAYDKLAASEQGDGIWDSSLAVAQRPRRSILPTAAKWEGKCVLVTGASGFVGGQLTARLLRLGACVVALSRRSLPPALATHPRVLALQLDLDGPKEEMAAIEASHPEVIFHLASCRDGPEIEDHAGKCVNANLRGTIQLLEAARRLSSATFVYADSAKVYGNSPVPHREHSLTDPGSSYAASKLAAWHYGRLFARLHGLTLVALRPTMIYGPGQENNLFTFLAKCLAAGNAEILLEGGLQTRDPLYIDDAINAYLRVAEAAHRLTGRAIPIGGGVERTVQDLAEQFVQMAGYRASVRNAGEKVRPTEMMRSYCDNADAWEALQWRPETPLTEGLRRTAQYLLGNQAHSGQTGGLAPPLDVALTAGLRSPVDGLPQVTPEFGQQEVEPCG